MKLVLLLTLFCVTFSASLPVDDPNDEVELVPIENTNKNDPETALGGGGGGFGGFPIVVIKTSSSGGNPFFGGGGGGGGFGAGAGFPSLFNNFFGGGSDDSSEGGAAAGGSLFPDLTDFHDSLVPKIDPNVFLGDNDDEEDNEEGGTEECVGLLCMLFKALGNRVKHIEDEIKEIQKNKQNEVEGTDNEPETTYEEKVLEDGTVVKINRTRYSDVSDDGTSYFGFHSTSFVSGGGDDEMTATDDEQDDDDADDNNNTKVTEETTTSTEAVSSVTSGSGDDDSDPIKLVRPDNVRK